MDRLPPELAKRVVEVVCYEAMLVPALFLRSKEGMLAGLQVTSVWGLKLLVYGALSYSCMGP